MARDVAALERIWPVHGRIQPVRRGPLDEAAWRECIALPDVTRLLEKLAWVPSSKPDEDQLRRLRQVVSMLEGGTPPVPVWDDALTAEGTVVSLETVSDSDGTEYRVELTVALPSETRRYLISFGYDDLHAAYAGWGRDDIAAHFATGRVLVCRCRAGDRRAFAVEAPFGFRPEVRLLKGS